MYDLDTIIQQNNEAALEWMMRGRQVEQAQSPKPEIWALTLLANKLKVGPPLLSALVSSFDNLETIEGFIDLIRELMPEHELEILSERRDRMLYRFCYLFGKKYFPLPPLVHDIGITEFLSTMPVTLMGMSYSSYHDIQQFRAGYLLLLSLVVYPFDGCELDLNDDSVPFNPIWDATKDKYKPSDSDIAWVKDLVQRLAIGGKWIAPMGFIVTKVAENKIELEAAANTPEVKDTIGRTIVCAKMARIEANFSRKGKTAKEKINGARVPLLESVADMVGREVASMIPGEGWQPVELQEMVAGTKYEGVGEFAFWACKDTGCVLLDCAFDNIEWQDDATEPLFLWTKYNVELLASQWPKVEAIRKKIDHIVDWLEADTQTRFKELVTFLKARKYKKAEPRNDYDELKHFIPLDQWEEKDYEQATGEHETREVRVGGAV